MSAQGLLQGCKSRCHWGLQSFQGSIGAESVSKLTLVVAGSGSSLVFGLRALIPCWLIARGLPQFLSRLPFSSQQVCKKIQGEKTQQDESQSLLSSNHRSDTTSLLSVLYVRSKSLGPAYTQRARLYKGGILGGRSPCEACQKSPATGISDLQKTVAWEESRI